jgi:hypothetical protein
MDLFNRKTLKTISEIFAQASPNLSDSELADCYTRFVHQFILAGALRMLRRKRWSQFRKVMDLFKSSKLKRPPWQYLILRWNFSLLSFLIFVTNNDKSA